MQVPQQDSACPIAPIHSLFCDRMFWRQCGWYSWIDFCGRRTGSWGMGLLLLCCCSCVTVSTATKTATQASSSLTTTESSPMANHSSDLPLAAAPLPKTHIVHSAPFHLTANVPIVDQDRLSAELHGLRQALLDELQMVLPPVPIRVALFPHREALATFLQENYPTVPPRRAMFLKEGSDLLVLASQGETLIGDLRHEATHALLHSTLPTVPIWIDEGLAEYFESGPTPGRLHPQHVQVLQNWLQTGWRPSLRELEHRTDIWQMTAADYRESWLWVHFCLHHSPQTRTQLCHFLETQRQDQPVLLADVLEQEIPNAPFLVCEHLCRLADMFQQLPAETWHNAGFTATAAAAPNHLVAAEIPWPFRSVWHNQNPLTQANLRNESKK